MMTCTSRVSKWRVGGYQKSPHGGIGHTQHGTTLVLLATAFCNVARHTQVHDGEIFDRVVIGFQAANDGKSTAIIHVVADGIELALQLGKGKDVRLDLVPVKTLLYGRRRDASATKAPRKPCIRDTGTILTLEVL